MGLFQLRKNKSVAMQNISKDYAQVLKKMCKFANVDFYSVDFDSPTWYTDYTWSEEQQDNFKEWYIKRLKKKNKFLHDQYVSNNASMFILNYGFKTT